MSSDHLLTPDLLFGGAAADRGDHGGVRGREGGHRNAALRNAKVIINEVNHSVY